MLYQSAKHRAELKLLRHPPNCTASDLFRDRVKAFFANKKENFGAIQPASSNRKTKGCKHAGRRNLRHCDVSRDENPSRENEIDSPSSEGFHAQLDCKLTYDNKNQTHRTLVKYIQFRVKKQNKTKEQKQKKQTKKTEQNRNDEEYWQTGITVKIHSNHEGAYVSCFSLHFVRVETASCMLSTKQSIVKFSIC